MLRPDAITSAQLRAIEISGLELHVGIRARALALLPQHGHAPALYLGRHENRWQLRPIATLPDGAPGVYEVPADHPRSVAPIALAPVPDPVDAWHQNGLSTLFVRLLGTDIPNAVRAIVARDAGAALSTAAGTTLKLTPSREAGLFCVGAAIPARARPHGHDLWI